VGAPGDDPALVSLFAHLLRVCAATLTSKFLRGTDGADALSRRRLLKAAVVGAFGAPVVGMASPAFAGYRVVASVAQSGVIAASPAQTMQGFGASGAWWPIDLAHFRPEIQEQVGELLFSPRGGIGLSAFRYNIGGGSVGVTNPHRAPQTFLMSPGQYDWTRDVGGRTFLTLASHHQVPILVGFVNSAPAVWTTNGLCTGGSLQPGAEAAYAGYLADIAAHFHDQGLITFTHISPMNEPDYRFEGGTQEGMGVPVGQRGTLVKAVGQALANKASWARVTADESSQVAGQLLPEAAQWLSADGSIAKQMDALSHHLYDFPSDATLQQARQLGERFGLPLWATEVCCIVTQTGTFGQQFDPTIGNALVVANLVWHCLTQANDSAFHWWVAASSAIGADPLADPEAMQRVNSDGWNDGLIYYDPNFAQNGNQQIYLTKRYWAMGNFSRYVRPGNQRHDVSGVMDPLRVLAFSTDQGWTVVAINNAVPGSSPAPLRLQFPSGGLLLPIETVETSAAHDLTPVAPPLALPNGQLQAALPAQSITTFILRA
jgi:O-glycosyl hydrolase